MSYTDMVISISNIIMYIIIVILIIFLIFGVASFAIYDKGAKKFRIVKKGKLFYPQYKAILFYNFKDNISFETQEEAENAIKEYKEYHMKQIIEVK